MRAPGGISLLEISSLALTATMRSLVARSPLCSAPAPRQGERGGKSRKRGISEGVLMGTAFSGYRFFRVPLFLFARVPSGTAKGSGQFVLFKGTLPRYPPW